MQVIFRMLYCAADNYSVDNHCAIHTPWSEATAKYMNIHNDNIKKIDTCVRVIKKFKISKNLNDP